MRIRATLQLQPISGVSFYRILQSASWYCLSALMLQYSFSKWSKECRPRLRRRAAWCVSNMFTKYRPKSFCSHSTSASAPWRTLKSKTNWEHEEHFSSRVAVLWFHIHVPRTRLLFSGLHCLSADLLKARTQQVTPHLHQGNWHMNKSEWKQSQVIKSTQRTFN